MKEDSSLPVIVIDCPRNRIRIHRNTLRLLGNPNHVVLLINPSNLTLAIAPSAKLQTSHTIRKEVLSNHQCFEICSKSLIQQLCAVLPEWDFSEKFRMTGEFFPKENIIQFDLRCPSERRLSS